MDKHLVLHCLDLMNKEIQLAILRKDEVFYNNGYKKVVDKTIEMIKNNQNIITILNQLKEYKKEGSMHQDSLFSNGQYDGANEILGILYDHIGEDNYDE